MTWKLARALRAEGGLLADHVRDDGVPPPAPDGPPTAPDGPPTAPDGPPTAASVPARLAASGPRVAGAAAEYELLLEMVVEGTLLHYATGRVVTPEDPDLALLLGDRLYALGLGRLAALGDLEAIAVLADVIAALAQAHAEGNPDRAGSIWEMGARAIGWGAGPSGLPL
jgi:hypothetical protein